MATANYCFEAGLIVGRLQCAMGMPLDKSTVEPLRKDAERALLRIGLRVEGLDQSNLPELSGQVQKICKTKESLCFELGLNSSLLQANLLMASFASESDSKISDADLSSMALPLKGLIEQMRLHAARIGALEIIRPFLVDVEKGISSPQELRLASANLFREVEIVKAQLEAWIENQSPDGPVDSGLKKRWSKADIMGLVGILIAIIAIVVGLLIPEVRRWLGLN
jgi:hypothetical protein